MLLQHRGVSIILSSVGSGKHLLFSTKHYSTLGISCKEKATCHNSPVFAIVETI